MTSELDTGDREPEREGEATAEPRLSESVVPGSWLSRSFALPEEDTGLGESGDTRHIRLSAPGTVH